MNPLANMEAEQCAQDIAAVFQDKVERQRIFAEFLAKHTNLKNWEGQAIGNRAVFLYRQTASAKAEGRS